MCVYVCMHVRVHDDLLIHTNSPYIYNTVRRTIISEARAFSREDSRQRDEIEKKSQSGGGREEGERNGRR